MNRVLLPLGCLVISVGTAAAQLSFTYETDTVLVASGDFGNADGRKDIVVVNRATGQVTFGRPDINGALQWSPPEPCGITNVTGLAVDKFAGGNVDLAAITAPGANRITLAGPNSANTQVNFRHIYPANPSPKAIAPFDPDADGNAELFIAGNSGNGTGQPYYYELRTGLGGASTQQWSTTVYPVDTYRAFRYVPKTGITPQVGEIYGSAFWTERVNTTGVSNAFQMPAVAVGVSTLMTYGNFDGSAYAQVILYSPNSNTARAAKVTEPSTGTYAFAAATTLTFPKPLRQLITIPTAAGARLGVIFSDLTGAIYDFDGTTLTLKNNLFGTPFDWLIPLGTDAIAAKSNLGWQRFNTSFAGTTLSPTHAGAYPMLGSKQRTSNVVFFSAEPFVDVAAVPVAQGSVRDWSTGASGTGTAWNVSAADFSLAAGIGLPTANSYTSAVSATHVLPNQYRSNISTRLLESSAGANVPDVTIYPPTGVYRPAAGGQSADEFFVTFNPTLSGMNVFYRINDGAWTFYNLNSPPKINGPATVEAYAGNLANKSPIRSATYTYTAIPALVNGTSPDLDGDGMPDAWEKGFNITDPQGDADGDGMSNLAEYLSGTDPKDSSQTPPPGPFVLNAQKSGNTMRLSWAITTSGTLQASPSLQGASWTNVTSGITVEGSENVYYVPTGGANPVRRFFRLSQ